MCSCTMLIAASQLYGGTVCGWMQSTHAMQGHRCVLDCCLIPRAFLSWFHVGSTILKMSTSECSTVVLCTLMRMSMGHNMGMPGGSLNRV